ncbi:MAG: trypsin-like peptidase domain-containing protein [Planctomycetes bacterium]|nr:trypsin-like peptidase domain-containing protein [Planctomycetota bacterium]
MHRCALALMVALAAGLPAAFAQEEDTLPRERILELESSFQDVATKARPSTVAVLGMFGMGSGSVIDPSGLVLTNAHVAAFARYAAIVFPDGTRLLGRRLGIYFPRDLALFQLPAGTYPAIELAAEERLPTGTWVVAYGHPGGLKPDLAPTFSAGQVTGTVKDVTVGGILDYTGGIETDLAIYSGNSGGPLIDLSGRLVGVNGAVNPLQGASYSLTMDIVRSVLPKIRQEKIYLSDDLVIDPTDPAIAGLFEAYDAWSREIAENWIANGWPGEEMPAPGREGGELERWAGRLLDRIESTRERIEDAPIWRGRHAEKREELLARSFASVFDATRMRTVRVSGSLGRTLCLGTVIAPGFVVTKASLVEKKGTIRIPVGGEETVVATLLATNEEHDLALYQAEGIVAPAGDSGSEKTEVGSWVLAAGDGGDAIAVGVLSAGARPIPADSASLLPKALSKIYMKALLEILRSSNTMDEFADWLEEMQRGQELFELGNRPRTYPKVLQHDAPLDVDQMGGPLLDREGRLLGVNIARAHHGTTYAVPIEVVREAFGAHLETR